VNRRDFQELSRIRLKEAKALLEQGLWDGAYYLAGYAVECALKACIAKGTQRYEFPDRKKVELSRSHDLSQLVLTAGLQDMLLERTRVDPGFEKNWRTAKRWSEQSRYRRHTSEAARDLVLAVSGGSHGVIAWIRAHW
jgi:HEPN domain-containing protein